MLSPIEIKGAAAAVTVAALLLTGTFTGAGIYRAYRRTGKDDGTPVASQGVAGRGRRLFFRSCAHCHGQDADGGEDAPSLRKLQISGAHMALVIRSGIEGEMPSFAKTYTVEETNAVVAYLKTLNQEPGG